MLNKFSFLSILLIICNLPIAEAKSNNFSGAWATTFGRLTLEEKAKNKISGVYFLGAEAGQLNGTLSADGKKLTFTYKESRVEGEGWFALNKDGKTFSGQWREKGTLVWQPWVGERLEKTNLDFNGVWQTNLGRLRLIEIDDRFEGVYELPQIGEITGKIKDRKFTFTYKEGVVQGEGWFEFAQDWRSFTGKWRPQGANEWQDWHGKRLEPIAGLKWLVILEARWESNLEAKEFSFATMLKNFFAGAGNVYVRSREFTDEKSFTKWAREVAFLPEPVVVAVASHGETDGLAVGGEKITAKAIAEAFKYANNITLLHFSACLMMKDKVPQQVQSHLGATTRFPISGYKTSVDWAGSAIMEFLYFELILKRGLSPQQAADKLPSLLPFSGTKDLPGAPFKSLGFSYLPGRP